MSAQCSGSSTGRGESYYYQSDSGYRGRLRSDLPYNPTRMQRPYPAESESDQELLSEERSNSEDATLLSRVSAYLPSKQGLKSIGTCVALAVTPFLLSGMCLTLAKGVSFPRILPSLAIAATTASLLNRLVIKMIEPDDKESRITALVLTLLGTAMVTTIETPLFFPRVISLPQSMGVGFLALSFMINEIILIEFFRLDENMVS
jgi:hypothetical protein